MSDKTYVVRKEQDRMGRYTTIYAGQDADKATDVANDFRVERDAFGKPKEMFIEVWQNGEHQYTTRGHLNKHDR